MSLERIENNKKRKYDFFLVFPKCIRNFLYIANLKYKLENIIGYYR